jgi:hypothetical protein
VIDVGEYFAALLGRFIRVEEQAALSGREAGGSLSRSGRALEKREIFRFAWHRARIRRLSSP